MTYNGYANKQTWLVNLWLFDDEEFVQQLRTLELYDAGQALEARVREMADNTVPDESSLIRDLLTSAIQQIDFHELAQLTRED